MLSRCEHCNKFKECTEVGKWMLCDEHKHLKQYIVKEKKVYELKRSEIKQNNKPINQISKKQAKKNSDYSAISKQYKKENPICDAQIKGICTTLTVDVHHKKGRIGELLTDTRYFLAVCRECHNHIETHPKFAFENNFSIRRN
jgi:2,3-bisphosphoglycerate-independent phosphoglycerate mutase